MKNKILLVDDEEILRITLKDMLEKEGYEVYTAEDGEKGWNLFLNISPEIVIADLKMPKIDGIELLEKVKNTSPSTIYIIITAYGTIQNAVKAIKMGAYDYITKPFLPEEFLTLINRAIQFYQIKMENKLLREKLGKREKFMNLIGKSEKMQKIYKIIETIADTNATVLIYGETGTGKELVAEAIHSLSKRKNKPLIKVNCAGLPETLLESELFGHEKGAFTDAISRKIGRFELADKGTIFLDDVDDMSMSSQVKLLRVLQEREFERLGGTETIKVDVRIIAASKRDLLELVKQGKFRDDLFYRLNVIAINLPPLRERKEDIPLLLEHFLNKYGKVYNKDVEVSEGVLNELMSYDWPGNVRELENIVERIVALSDKEKIETLSNIFIKISNGASNNKIFKNLKDFLREKEKEFIMNVLKSTEGRKEKAAKILGISRKTLWQKLKEYEIDKM